MKVKCDICGYVTFGNVNDMCCMCENGAYVPIKPDNVIHGNFITTLDLQADTVLKEAIGNLKSVVIAGYDNDGEFYAASSIADGGGVLWMLELCKQRLFECVDTKE